MAISLMEDIKTMKEFQEQLPEAMKQIHRTGRPIIVTVGGKPDVVLLDAAVYERRLKTVNLARLLAEAENDVRTGKTRTASSFLSELHRVEKVSR